MRGGQGGGGAPRGGGGPAVRSLGVSDRPMLLPQVEPQLALVSEVEVTFLTLHTGGERDCVSIQRKGL